MWIGVTAVVGSAAAVVDVVVGLSVFGDSEDCVGVSAVVGVSAFSVLSKVVSFV